jgi:hypothetical protein
MAVVVPIVSEWNPKGLDKAVADLKRAEGGWAKTGQAVKSMAVPAAAGLALIAAGALKAADKASALGESVNAVNKVFGKSASEIEEFGKTSAQNVGLSTRAWNELATATGSTLTNMGADSKEAADGTKILGQRAADMASVFNTDVASALEAINSGLRGEAEPLRKYGVSLSAAAIEAKAMALGLDKDGKNLDNHTKSLAAQALILDQTAKTAGDFADTSDGLANRQRILAAESENAQAALGEALLPTMEKLVGLFSSMAGWIGRNVGLVQIIVGVVAVFAAAIIALNIALGIYNTIQTLMAINSARAAAGQWALNAAMLANPVGLIIVAVIALIAIFVLLWRRFPIIGETISKVWAKIKDATKSAFDFIAKVVRAAWDVLKALFKATPIGLVITHLDDLKAAFKTVTEAIVRSFEWAWDKISAIIDKIKSGFGAVGDFLGGLNPFAASASASSGVAAAGVPSLFAGSGRKAGGGGSVNITIQGAVDPEGTARQIQRLLYRHDTRQGRTPGTTRALAW